MGGLGAWAFGARWFARADPFEVYSMAVSRLSPFRRAPASGRIELINPPLDHLPTLPVRPGTVAVLAVLLGSTAFDSFSQAPAFRNFVDRTATGVPFFGDAGGATVLRTTALVVFVAVVGTTFWGGAARATGGISLRSANDFPAS